MKCFYHNDKNAIGLCFYCGRALCKECAVEYDKGLSCPGNCVKKVEQYLVNRNNEMILKKRLLKAKINIINKSLFKNVPPKLWQWLLVVFFISLVYGIYYAHNHIYPSLDRQEVEFGLSGTIISLAIPTYLHYHRKSGGIK